MQIGIYTITNLINGKIYVGYSKNLCKREINHFSNLKHNRHCNIYLQNAIEKYGAENLKFDVIEYCLEKDLAEREHYWATFLKTHDRKIGYNIRPTDPKNKMILSEESKVKMRNSKLGRKLPLSTNLKMSISQKERLTKIYNEGGSIWNKGIEMNKNNPVKSKAVIQFDLDGNFIQEWVSMSEAGRHGYNVQHICSCCQNNRKTHKKFIWKYKIIKYE